MPEERLVTISTSSHLAPDEVARHSFGTVRRGYDPGEVRAYLESLAVGLRGVAEREQELLDQLSDAEHRAAHPVLDDATLTAALGTETARVLHSAHEAAADMMAKAEADSSQLLAEAAEEIQRSRADAEAQLAERASAIEATAAEVQERTEHQAAAMVERARQEAAGLVEQAREQCRGMVDEAQALRARVLADLAKRRKVLHAQIEQLRAGRERLAETVHDVRAAIDGIATDLFAAEDNARLAAEAAGREALERAEPDEPEALAAQLLAEERQATAVAAGPGSEEAGPASAEAGTDVEEGEDPGAEDGQPTATEAEDVDALFARLRAARLDEEAPTGTAPVPEPEPVPESAVPGEAAGTGGDGGDRADLADRGEAPAGGTGPERSGGDTASAVREVRAGDGAEDRREEELDGEELDGENDGPPEERHPLAVQRDELVAPIVTTLSRRLKRTLQDGQNDLLDRLRSQGSRWSLDLLVDETEQIDSVATAALPALEQAAAAGVSFSGIKGAAGPKTDVLAGVAGELADAMVGPLRRRLAAVEGLEDADESVVAEHVGSAFREWKGERIERLAADHVVAAFSAGTMAAAVGAGAAPVEWVAVSDSGDVPCPDCEDNGLNGSQNPGEEFPTGHRHPPAHPGCRCLLALSST